MKDFSIRCNNISEFIKMQEYFFKKNIFWCDNDHKILTSNQLYPAWICFQGNAFYYSIYNPIGEIIIDYKQFIPDNYENREEFIIHLEEMIQYGMFSD